MGICNLKPLITVDGMISLPAQYLKNTTLRAATAPGTMQRLRGATAIGWHKDGKAYEVLFCKTVGTCKTRTYV